MLTTTVRLPGWHVLALAGLTTTAACGVTDPSTFPCLEPGPEIGNRQLQSSGGGWTNDDEFAAIARETVGGFGGLFLNRYQGHGLDNKYNIYLRDMSRSDAAIAEIIPRLQAWQASWPMPLNGSNFNSLQGQFDYAQLKSCYQVVQETSIAGIVSTDIDEGVNRIFVGVEDDTAMAQVPAELEHAGVPRDMLIVDVEPPPVPGAEVVKRAPSLAKD